MAFPIENKLVIAIASSALFDLTESDAIFKSQGEDKYRQYQNKNINRPFAPGVAFPFIKRMLSLNTAFPDIKPVEVILMSRNSPETGLRAFRSIEHYNLEISRASFTSGNSNYQYLPGFNASLFLSANQKDVTEALNAGYAAGRVVNDEVIEDDESDNELRIAFDFDGVLADDASEKVYKSDGLESYLTHEHDHANEPLSLGPIGELLRKISYYQKREKLMRNNDSSYSRIIKTYIVTARNAPAHERVITSLKDWGVEVDEAFFLGGIDKSRILEIIRPHIFFDDQMTHLKNLRNVPAVHIPFGIANS